MVTVIDDSIRHLIGNAILLLSPHIAIGATDPDPLTASFVKHLEWMIMGAQVLNGQVHLLVTEFISVGYGSEYPSASALLLDSNVLGQPGGSGKTFDWEQAPQLNQPIIVAGGLDANNVAMAIKQIAPYAVDVSSGIEAAKGEKDLTKMRNFVQSVRAADER